MSVPSNEPNGEQPNGQAQEVNTPGHPAWQEILDVLPESLHGVVTPALQKWDEGVKSHLTEVQSKYTPYKSFVDESVDPDLLQRAYALAQQIESDPQSVVQQAIEAFGLPYVPKTELEALQQAAQQQVVKPNEYDLDDDDNDFFNDPRFKQVLQTLESMQGKLTAQEQQDLEDQRIEAFESTLESLQEKHGEFDRMFVTALMTQGASGEEAVKQYHNTINQAAAKLMEQNNQKVAPTAPPIVMGGDGTTGSGIPQQPIDYGSMEKKDLNQLVVDILNKSQE